MRRWLLWLLPWALLLGCASKPVTVEVPLPVSCMPQVSDNPIYADAPDAVKASRNIEERVRRVIAGREQRDARIAELAGALEACKLPSF